MDSQNQSLSTDAPASAPPPNGGGLPSTPGGAARTPPAAKPADVSASAKPTAPAALVESTPDSKVNKMRRWIVWSSIGSFLLIDFLMFLRFFLPRSIFEPSSVFRIGVPSDYALGVDTKWQQQYRIWVTRTSDRLFVIYARCTHLGCTPDWKASENKFKCPCHGSGYDSEGINFEGPAPRPMDRAKVELDAEGQIVVDISTLYEQPKGGFDDPHSFIQV
ncbi:MAG TPA: Rieske 2Fe-2S domain-containing protein [Pyrinomonadaceae bacterium]